MTNQNDLTISIQMKMEIKTEIIARRAEIIRRLKTGERKADIARSLGMSKQAMYHYVPTKLGVCSQCRRPFVKVKP